MCRTLFVVSNGNDWESDDSESDDGNEDEKENEDGVAVDAIESSTVLLLNFGSNFESIGSKVQVLTTVKLMLLELGLFELLLLLLFLLFVSSSFGWSIEGEDVVAKTSDDDKALEVKLRKSAALALPN